MILLECGYYKPSPKGRDLSVMKVISPGCRMVEAPWG